jgi:hypothetical protein
MFSEPYIDVDEWRDTPVRHRYVHGGFKGTEARFSFYFPPKEQYQGRFFQAVSAIAGDENFAEVGTKSPIIGAFVPIWSSKNTLPGFAASSGAYLVVTNNGSTHGIGQSQDPNVNTVIGFRANAAAAQYSREVAAKMYGAHRPYGYIYGGSGGSIKTVCAFENTFNVWDGAVPYIYGSPIVMPNVFTSAAYAERVLKDKFPSILDAIAPGGSGDMYAGLNQEQREVLREVTRFGIPPRTWFAYQRLGYGPLAGLIDIVKREDPTYFDDFWKVPGYLGFDPPESFKRAHIQQATSIVRIVNADEARKMGLQLPVTAWAGDQSYPAAIQVKDMPQADLLGATLIVRSGASTGKVLSVSSVKDGFITLGLELEQYAALGGLKVGDELLIDNSVYLALQTYHHHQVSTPDFYVFNEFRGPDGKPLYPQRPRVLGPDFVRGNGGCTTHTGWLRSGKMIMVETLVDEYAHPWSADWYYARVKETMGDRADNVFRVWFVDNAMHGPPASQKENSRLIEYTNVLEQALRDLSAWVERGIAPPASTGYRMVDGQVEVASTAAERKGVQPVVTLTVGGGARVDARVGQKLTFSGIIEVPPNAGKVVGAEWDFEGDGTYPVHGNLKTDASGTRATIVASYAFKSPGTYFPSLRATSQRQPDNTSYAQIPNLAQVRVVVK